MTQKTVFDSPLITSFLRLLSTWILKLSGWQVEGQLPKVPKFVLIAAPHTSTWDGIFMVMVAFVFRVKLLWMGKHTLFSSPLGPVIRWLGGVPINRTAASNTVQQAARVIREADHMVLAVPPEGTRQRVNVLKSGFYYIALAAKVPIVLGYLDYRRKITGVGPTLMPSGDFEADLKIIKAFYATMTGKYKNQSALTQETAFKEEEGDKFN